MTFFHDIFSVFRRNANAAACIRGSEKYPCIRGRVLFYQCCGGVIVRAEMTGLPAPNEPCKSPIFAFHIHNGTECSGNESDPFLNADGHYDPDGCLHPDHAGDMPPLFCANGKAFLAFLTDRFTVAEILGRTVIIHGSPDDFTTQPSGSAGEKIACGVIKPA